MPERVKVAPRHTTSGKFTWNPSIPPGSPVTALGADQQKHTVWYVKWSTNQAVMFHWKIWRSKTHPDFTVTYFETFILSLAWSVDWSEGCDNIVTYCEAESCNIMIPCQFNITPLTSRFFIIFKITKMCTLLFAFTKTRAQCSVTDSSQGCIILLD